MTDRHLAPAVAPDSFNFDDPADVRLALNVCRDQLIDSAGELAQAVRARTDDPLLYELAGLVVSSLKVERRIRRLLASEVAG